MRCHLFCQLTALGETDIPRRRTDQAAHRVGFRVFAHIKPDQADAERLRELLRKLSLADTGGTREEEGTHRAVRLVKARTGETDGRHYRVHRFVLTENPLLQVFRQVIQLLFVALRERRHRDLRHLRDGFLNLPLVDYALSGFGRQEPLRGTRLIDHIDRLIRQPLITHIALRKRYRGLNRLIGVLEAVMLLKLRAKPLQDLN